MANIRGDRVRAAREAAGWSQARLADELNRASGHPTLTRHDVSRWESGARTPSTFWRPYLEHALGVELRAMDQVEPDRRSVLGTLGVVAAVGGTGARLEALRRGFAATVSPGRAVEQWRGIADEYSRDVFSVHASELLPDLEADLIVLLATLDADPENLDLLQATGNLSTVAAISLASVGRMRHAGRWWATAQEAAERSGHLPTRMLVRDTWAVNRLYEGRQLSQVLGVLDEAYALGGQTPCRGTAGVLAGRAQAFALAGRADDAVAALDELGELTERLPAETLSETEGIHGWPTSRYHHTASYVLTALGRTSEANAAQDAALAAYTPAERLDAAKVELHRARCIVIDGDPAAGIAHAHNTLDELPTADHSALLYRLGRAVVGAVPASQRGDGTRELTSRTGASLA